MSSISDMIHLSKDLASCPTAARANEIVHSIQELAVSLLDEHTDLMARDLRLLQENAELRRRLSEIEAEEVRVEHAVEFRRGKRTGDKWVPFCPKCHMPAVSERRSDTIECSASCGWLVLLPKAPEKLIAELQ